MFYGSFERYDIQHYVSLLGFAIYPISVELTSKNEHIEVCDLTIGYRLNLDIFWCFLELNWTNVLRTPPRPVMGFRKKRYSLLCYHDEQKSCSSISEILMFDSEQSDCGQICLTAHNEPVALQTKILSEVYYSLSDAATVDKKWSHFIISDIATNLESLCSCIAIT